MVLSLRVRIELTPEQVKDYCVQYGIDRAELRENVASYVQIMVQGSPGLSVEDGSAESVTVS